MRIGPFAVEPLPVVFAGREILVCQGEVGGLTRRLLLANHVAGAGPRPLVVELHGSGLFPYEQMVMSGLHLTGAEAGFLVAAPEAGVPFQLYPDWAVGTTWRLPGMPLPRTNYVPDGPDDAGFVLAMIDALVDAGLADPKRVYVTGFSAGGRFASHLAAVAPERFAGAAPVAGLRLSQHATAAPPPILSIHGRLDELNAFEGGLGPRWDLGVEETVAAYAERFGWPAATRQADGELMTRLSVHDGQGVERLRQYVVDDGRHVWPSSTDPVHGKAFGPVTTALDATAEMCRFWGLI